MSRKVIFLMSILVMVGMVRVYAGSKTAGKISSADKNIESVKVLQNRLIDEHDLVVNDLDTLFTLTGSVSADSIYRDHLKADHITADSIYGSHVRSAELISTALVNGDSVYADHIKFDHATGDSLYGSHVRSAEVISTAAISGDSTYGSHVRGAEIVSTGMVSADSSYADHIKYDHLTGDSLYSSHIRGVEVMSTTNAVDSIWTNRIRYGGINGTGLGTIDSVFLSDSSGTAKDTLILKVSGKILKIFCDVGK